MAKQSVTISVDAEVVSIGSAAAQEITDVKAGKGNTVYISDALPILLALASNYAALPADVKSAGDWGYLVSVLGPALGLQP